MSKPTIEELIEILLDNGGLVIESEELTMEVHEGGYYLGSDESDDYVTDDNRSHEGAEGAIRYMVRLMGGLDNIIHYDEA